MIFKKIQRTLSLALASAMLFVAVAPLANAVDYNSVQLTLDHPGIYTIENVNGKLKVNSRGGIVSDLILIAAAPTAGMGYQIVYNTTPEFETSPTYVFNPISDYDQPKFTVPVSLRIPVKNTKDGDVVAIYSSDDGHQWFYRGVATIHDGKAAIMTDHFSYFAFQKSASANMNRTRWDSYNKRANWDFRFVDTYGHWAESYIRKITEKGVVVGRGTDQFFPDEALTRAELVRIAVKAFGLQVPETVEERPFVDVSSNAWYAPYAVAAQEYGFIRGARGRFSPNSFVSRAEALKILIQAAGFEDVDDNFDANYASNSGWWYVGYKDVPMDSWFAKFVAYARDSGIISGFGDGLFHPEKLITRAEVAKILVGVLELKGEI